MAGASDGALDEVSDTLDHPGAHATPHAAIIPHDNPCPVASRACPGDPRAPSPPARQQRKRQQIGDDMTQNEQDIDASELDKDRTACTVRARPAARHVTLFLDSQSRSTAHCLDYPFAAGNKEFSFGSVTGHPSERGADPIDGQWSLREVGRPVRGGSAHRHMSLE